MPTLAGLFGLLFGAVLSGTASRPARAEVIEEIVAHVNDDIITRSDVKEAEQQVIEEIYSKGGGEAGAAQLEKAKSELLRDLITRRLLIQQAERLYDIAKMQDAFIRQFKEQQKLGSNAELERLLKEEGLTLDDFKAKLIEINAPSSVLDLEVRSKISVSDAEIQSFYQAHASEIASPDKASFREIVLLTDDSSLSAAIELGHSLAARARAGADFVELAKENSHVDSSVRGAMLGPFTKGELAPELERAVFSMKPGEVSEPIVIGKAVHVIRLEGREESATPSLESMKEKLSDSIEREKFNAALREYLDGLWQRSKIHVADAYVERVPPELRKYLKD